MIDYFYLGDNDKPFCHNECGFGAVRLVADRFMCLCVTQVVCGHYLPTSRALDTFICTYITELRSLWGLATAMS